jgi:hypothetical protein
MQTTAPLVYAARNLLKQFKKLTVPHACAYLLVAWLNHEHAQDYAMPEDQRQLYANRICGTAWKWVTRPRTEAELQTIIAMKCSCSLEERQKSSHALGEHLYSGVKIGFESLGWYTAYSCFRLMVKVDGGDVLPLNKFNRRKQWPHSIHRVLPHGPSDTLQGICQWMKFNHPMFLRARIMNDLRIMLAILSPLLIPHFITSRVLLDGASHLPKVKQVITEVLSERATGSHKALLSEACQDCNTIVPFAHDLVFKYMNATERKIFHLQFPAELLAVYDGARSTSDFCRERVQEGEVRGPVAEASRELANFSPHITALRRMLCLDWSGLYSDYKLFEQQYMNQPESDALDIPTAPPAVDRLDRELEWLKHSPRCTAPTCSRTAADSRLMLCSGCRYMKYCSRRCQKRAWTHAQAAHRDVCVLLAKSDGFDVGGVESELSISNDEDEAQASFILDHLEQLTLLKVQFLNPGANISVDEVALT